MSIAGGASGSPSDVVPPLAGHAAAAEAVAER